MREVPGKRAEFQNLQDSNFLFDAPIFACYKDGVSPAFSFGDWATLKESRRDIFLCPPRRPAPDHPAATWPTVTENGMGGWLSATWRSWLSR